MRGGVVALLLVALAIGANGSALTPAISAPASPPGQVAPTHSAAAPAAPPLPAAPLTRGAPRFSASGLTVTGNFMPWVCQFCTWSGSESAFAAEYAPYAYNMTQLSYEMYDLCTTSPYFCSRGYEGTSNDLTPFAHQYGIRALPMITSATLTTIQGFVDTNSEWTPFINQAISDATTYGYGGYNIDWEPGSDTTVAGGYEYAHFLDQFANATHAHGMILTVDFARWDPNFWNLPAFAQTTTDTFMDMNYECPGSTFTSYLSGDTSTFALSQIGEALDPESGCTDAQMVSLLGQVAAAGVTNTEWWALDDTTASLDNAHLWTAVHDFVYNGAHNGTTTQAYNPASWGLATNEYPSTGGGTINLFTLGTDEQGYETSALTGSVAITSVNLTIAASLNPANYRIYEGNLSSTGTILSSWQLPVTNSTLHLGTPPGSTATTSLMVELATDPSGTLGGYLAGGPGTYAFFQFTVNGGGGGPPLALGTFTATPPTVQVGNGTYLNVTASGGAPPYSYVYSALPTGCASTNVSSLHCFPTVAGNYTVGVAVTDTRHATVSGSVPLTVLAAPVGTPGILSFSVSPAIIPLGGTTYVNASAVGSGLTYVYLSLPPGCTSANVTSLPCVPNTAGSYSVSVTVTNPQGKSASAGPQSLTVRAGIAPVTVVLLASPGTIVLGGTAYLNASAAGGTLPYSYAYTNLPVGCSTLNQSSLPCTPTAAGTYTVGVQVTDPAARSAWGNATLIVTTTPPIAPLVITSFSAIPARILLGDTTNLSVQASGGAAPYSYAYTGLPSGCRSANFSTLACQPIQLGNFSILVQVHDTLGGSAANTTVLEVLAATTGPSISAFVVSPNPIELTGTAHLSVVASGGAAPLSYAYSGLPSGCASGDSAILNCTPTVTGNFSVIVTVSDAQGRQASSAATLEVLASSNAHPSNGGYSLSTTDLLLLGIVLVAAVAIVVAAATRRKKGQLPPGAAAPGSEVGYTYGDAPPPSS